MSTADDFRAEVTNWIGGNPKREALLAPKVIAESTLKAFLNGRYNPGKFLEIAIKAEMAKYPQSEKAAV